MKGLYERRTCGKLKGGRGCGKGFWPQYPNQQVCAGCGPKLRAAYLLRFQKLHRKQKRQEWTGDRAA